MQGLTSASLIVFHACLPLQEDEPEAEKPREQRPVLAETFKSGNLRSNQETFKAQEESRYLAHAFFG